MTKLTKILILALGGTSLIISLIIGGLAFAESKRVTTIEAKNHLRELLEKNALLLDARIQEVTYFTSYIIEVALRDFNLKEIKGNKQNQKKKEEKLISLFLEGMKASNARSAWIHFDSKVIDGTLHVSYSKQKDKIVKSEVFDIYESGHDKDEWFIKAKTENYYWTKPYFWEPWGVTLISYSRKAELNGDYIGVAGSDMFMDDLFQEFQKHKIYKTGSIFLLNQNFDILYHTESNFKNLKTDEGGKYSFIADQIIRDKNNFGIIEFSMNGKDRLIAYRKLSNNWVLAAEPFLEEMYAAQKNLSVRIFFVLVIGIAISFLLSVYLGRAISIPIIELTSELTQKNTELLSKNAEIESQKKELDYFANYDALTGIPNRRAGILFLNQMVENAYRDKKDLTIVFIDVNNLKTVNDKFGHKEGDNLIRAVSRYLLENIRETDKLARLGGDEFLLILPDSNEEEAMQILNRIEKKIELEKNYHPYPISFSYGYEKYPTYSTNKIDIDDFIKSADMKMYEHKLNYKRRAKDSVEKILD